MNLNDLATPLADAIVNEVWRLRFDLHQIDGARVVDCGVSAKAGLEAGRRLAEVCLAGLGEVTITRGDASLFDGPSVVVRTDHPLAACMASQYAGWAIEQQVADETYFAMGSGPFRAAAAREPLFEESTLAPFAEKATHVVGCLESSSLPPAEVCQELAEKCGVAAKDLTLLVAPTNSQAGAVQVVARSIETALHKLHELDFDLSRIESAWGSAPLPPVAGDTMTGIGRTNDAVLYGGHAVLYVRGDDASLAEVGPQTPSSASPDHGRPFHEIFQDYDNDFYKIDKLLFSPAMITLVNLDTGVTHRFGGYEPAVLAQSFGAETLTSS
ncbi:MAG: methenyltetrahydromethanopterin cyclohydrolase [Planctomycetota bacterium]